jgi:squalene-hopene/tetraprenyl-beta-curcumene cyclase
MNTNQHQCREERATQIPPIVAKGFQFAVISGIRVNSFMSLRVPSWVSLALLAVFLVSPNMQAADESLRHEVQLAIDRGLSFLKAQQHTNGSWSLAEHPALTALALSAFMNEPSGHYRKAPAEFLRRGYAHLLQQAQPDGGIYAKSLQSYNTSLAVMALLAARDPAHEPVIRRARKFIAGQQNDFNERGRLDAPTDGGVGYGNSTPHADLSNTLLALEALRYSRRGEGHQPDGDGFNWDAAIDFIQRCQNLPSHNREPWASDDAGNKGGFVYFPGNSKAGETNLPNGRVALRSYGSMTYAGLLSFLYADVKRDDPRVVAAQDWLRRNYTLDENPGMGAEGRFYYFHTMAKTLGALGIRELPLADGTVVNWRSALAKKLFDLQSADGSWTNPGSGRWMEKDPVLVTSYAVLSLTHLQAGL